MRSGSAVRLQALVAELRIDLLQDRLRPSLLTAGGLDPPKPFNLPAHRRVWTPPKPLGWKRPSFPIPQELKGHLMEAVAWKRRETFRWFWTGGVPVQPPNVQLLQ